MEDGDDDALSMDKMVISTVSLILRDLEFHFFQSFIHSSLTAFSPFLLFLLLL